MLVDVVDDATIGHEDNDNDDAADTLHCLLNELDAAAIRLPHNLLAAILSISRVDVGIRDGMMVRFVGGVEVECRLSNWREERK